MTIKRIPNQIINEPLNPLRLDRVDGIALHHMDCDLDVKGIERIHINKGWRAIGYNYFVSFDGDIYEGRGLNVGAGVENENGHIISIGFQGDYHSKDRKMPDEQFNSGIDIINYLKDKVPTIKKICGHKEYMATACPGKYFPLEEMKSLKKRGELNLSQYNELKSMIEELKPKYYDRLEDCPNWAKPYVSHAMEKGYIKGNEKGQLQLTDDRIWALVVMLRIKGEMK